MFDLQWQKKNVESSEILIEMAKSEMKKLQLSVLNGWIDLFYSLLLFLSKT